ncbi:uncharacterized protein EI90DRAFT_2124081 [Cantharellus anzutake]|uniref:uncharacterized protein n=1 Tax=Cantharellus anzutake TaxID=1750568 RepID=UPI0019047AE4|nr:uncharacterized protein EI90DRAFT_2124081 [Cantharellus anzutake]KAF8325567.1 hypothetical protein EI90DRAFT_2124081 [Cantharellus anzutake]
MDMMIFMRACVNAYVLYVCACTCNAVVGFLNSYVPKARPKRRRLRASIRHEWLTHNCVRTPLSFWVRWELGSWNYKCVYVHK